MVAVGLRRGLGRVRGFGRDHDRHTWLGGVLAAVVTEAVVLTVSAVAVTA